MRYRMHSYVLYALISNSVSTIASEFNITKIILLSVRIEQLKND